MLSIGGPLRSSLPLLPFSLAASPRPPPLRRPPKQRSREGVLGFRALSRSRALALSRSRALVLACLLLSLNSAAKLVLFAEDTSKKQRLYCSRSNIYLISLPPSPFPLCPASNRPRQQRAEMTVRCRLCARTLLSLFVRNGKAGAFRTSLVQRLDGRRLPIVARECDLCGRRSSISSYSTELCVPRHTLAHLRTSNHARPPQRRFRSA